MQLKIGTRGSKLALYQANLVKKKLKDIYKDIDISVEVIKTSGDKILTASLSSYGGKGLFVKEIEDAILKRRVDIAVHSLKDIPQTIAGVFKIGCVLKRDDPRDCVILKNKASLDTGSNTEHLKTPDVISALKNHAVIGTSSLRRQCLLKRLREDLVFEPLRGNINTRIGKLRKGYFDAVVLSASGLIRLGMKPDIDAYLEPSYFIPQCGQGAIAVEYLSENDNIDKILKPLNDEDTYCSTFAERTFIKTLNCGCASPVGAFSSIDNETINIKGFVANIDGEYLEDEIKSDKRRFEELGRNLAVILINKGALEILSKNTI